MKRESLESALDECLTRMEKGENLEKCLERHPELAPQLKPLLKAAGFLRKINRLELSRKTIDQGWERILPVLEEVPSPRENFLLQALALLRQRVKSLLPQPGFPRLLAQVAAVFLAFLIVMSGVTFAARGSIPGSPLYPVKRGLERVRYSAAPSIRTKTLLHLAQAKNRLAEAEKLVSQNRVDKIPVLITEIQRDLNEGYKKALTLPKKDKKAILLAYLSFSKEWIDFLKDVEEDLEKIEKEEEREKLEKGREGKPREEIEKERDEEFPEEEMEEEEEDQIKSGPDSGREQEPTQDQEGESEDNPRDSGSNSDYEEPDED